MLSCIEWRLNPHFWGERQNLDFKMEFASVREDARIEFWFKPGLGFDRFGGFEGE